MEVQYTAKTLNTRHLGGCVKLKTIHHRCLQFTHFLKEVVRVVYRVCWIHIKSEHLKGHILERQGMHERGQILVNLGQIKDETPLNSMQI